MRLQIHRSVLSIIEGDITELAVDAIVNAANSRLMGGGGVDGAIHGAAGPSVLDECARFNGCPTGSAVATSAGRLRARHIFHAVGPEYDDGRSGERELLRSAYRACLDLARAHECKTIAFPAISTGVYAYPLALATEVALETIGEHLAGDTGLERVTCVMYDRWALAEATAVARRLARDRGWPVTDDAGA